MAYTFPFTTAGELNLDWVLEQVTQMNNHFANLQSNVDSWTTEIQHTVNLLQDFNSSLINLLNFFPSGSFSFSTHDYTIAGTQITGVISNLTVAKNLEANIDEAVAEQMQTYVDQCQAIYENLKSQDNRGNYISFEAAQYPSGTQKSTALNNIGLTPPNVMYSNMFNLESLKSCEVVKTTSSSSGFHTTNGHATTGTYDLQTYSWEPSETLNPRFRARTKAAFFGSNYTYESESQPSSVNYLAQGYYTVSCKVTILNSEFQFPSQIIMTGAVKHGNAVDAPSGPRNYCDYTNSSLGSSFNVYGTATRGEIGANAHVFNENNEAYFRKTFYVPTNGEWSPAFAFQWTNNALASTYVFPGNVKFSEIQIEIGKDVTDYKPFGSGVIINSNVDTTEIQNEVDTLKQAIWHDQLPMMQQISDHLKNLDTNGLSDSLLFFTDCHPSEANGYDAWQQRVYSILGIMSKAARSFPANLVLNGGDWLLSTETDYNAQIGKLSYIFGLGDEMIGHRLHWVMGNHDFNVNNTAVMDNVIPQSAAGAVFPEPYTFYVIDEPMRPFKYMVFNTSIGANSSAWWMLNQIRSMADYLLAHPGDYVFVPHIFAASSKSLIHSVQIGTVTPEGQDPVPLYGPEVTLKDDALKNVTMAIADLAHAYNSNGIFEYQGYSWNFSGIDPKLKIRYIMAGHLHKEGCGIYRGDVPYYMAGSFGYLTASGSSPRPDPHYTDIINTVFPEDGNSAHYFGLVNPVQWTGTAEYHSTEDVGKTIQQCDLILQWLAGAPQWTVVYTQP